MLSLIRCYYDAKNLKVTLIVQKGSQKFSLTSYIDIVVISIV